MITVPSVQHRNHPMIDHSVLTINAIDVDLWQKLHCWWFVWITFTAFHFQRVHPIFIWCSRRANDHASPVSERHVIIILKSPGNGAIAYSLLACFQLFQEPKVTRYHHTGCGGHCGLVPGSCCCLRVFRRKERCSCFRRGANRAELYVFCFLLIRSDTSVGDVYCWKPGKQEKEKTKLQSDENVKSSMWKRLKTLTAIANRYRSWGMVFFSRLDSEELNIHTKY